MGAGLWPLEWWWGGRRWFSRSSRQRLPEAQEMRRKLGTQMRGNRVMICVSSLVASSLGRHNLTFRHARNVAEVRFLPSCYEGGLASGIRGSGILAPHKRPCECPLCIEID
jgi:hypothetical protein